jgi:prepilin-type N-terminal cleavage/methylation domain-containing protein
MKRRPAPGIQSGRGFSLMELAIALMIVGTLMSGVLVAIGQMAENGRIANSQAQLREIQEALYGFAQAYGRLPCPATDMSTSPNLEDITCSSMHGFVPSGTLGLDGATNADGLLVDPWQQPLRYSLIITATANNPNFSNTASIQTFFTNSTAITNPNPYTSMFRVCDDNTCAEVDSDIVPAVVLSLGKNAATYSPASSADELLNAGTDTMSGYAIKDDYDFVSATYSEDNFDDQLVWISPYVLFNRLVSAGKLP